MPQFSMIVVGAQSAVGGHVSPLSSPTSQRLSLFDSYNSTVSTASMEEFCRTVLSWLDQHCSLVVLRPGT